MNLALILYCRYRFGGAERRLLRVFSELGQSHEATLIVKSCSRSKLKENLELAGCDIESFARVKAIDFGNSLIEDVFVLTELVKLRPDATLVVDSCGLNYAVAKVLHAFNKRLILTIANGLYFYDAANGREDKSLLRLLKVCDQIDLLYPGHADYFSKHVNSNCCISITPGTFTDLDLFQPEKKENTFVFLAARLEEQKNPWMMVEAAKLCADALRRYSYRIIICGQGWEEDAIRARIRESHLEDVVTMPGYVPSHEVLPSAAVLCAIQLVNNYPSQTIAEAAACGCFVIATDVGETFRLIDESYSIGIEPTASALANSMVSYMELPEATKAGYISAARNYAHTNYSIDQSVEYFEELFENVCG